jgi:hypothetical protein
LNECCFEVQECHYIDITPVYLTQEKNRNFSRQLKLLKEYCLLGCDAMKSSRSSTSLLPFVRNVVPSFSGSNGKPRNLQVRSSEMSVDFY